jgi:hypothetical protein
MDNGHPVIEATQPKLSRESAAFLHDLLLGSSISPGHPNFAEVAMHMMMAKNELEAIMAETSESQSEEVPGA